MLILIRPGLIARQHAWRLFAYSVFLCVFVCVRTVRGVHARFKVREVQAGPEASAKPKTSKTSTSAAAPSKASTSKPAVKKSAATAAEAKKDTTVVTKSQAELKAMADALLAQATQARPQEGCRR